MALFNSLGTKASGAEVMKRNRRQGTRDQQEVPTPLLWLRGMHRSETGLRWDGRQVEVPTHRLASHQLGLTQEERDTTDSSAGILGLGELDYQKDKPNACGAGEGGGSWELEPKPHPPHSHSETSAAGQCCDSGVQTPLLFHSP